MEVFFLKLIFSSLSVFVLIALSLNIFQSSKYEKIATPIAFIFLGISVVFIIAKILV